MVVNVRKAIIVWWPWKAPLEERSMSWSVSDPAMAEFFGVGTLNHSGVAVNETSALGLSAVYRAVSLIAGSIASLPMRTLAARGPVTERAKSFLDNPGGPGGLTPFEWKETVLVHLLLLGNAFLAHVVGGANQIVGLAPVHPLAVTVDVDKEGQKTFTVALADGTRRVFNSQTMTHITAMTTDGVRGLSPITVARNTFATSIAGEEAAGRMFRSGAMIGGLVTGDVTLEEAQTIKDVVQDRVGGLKHAGEVAVFNRDLSFTPLSMSAEDAQFIQSRAFQVEEIARMYGIPPHLLAQSEKSTSWGTGIESMNRGLARYTLIPWSTRIEERLTRLLAPGKKVEFDYHSLLKPAPEEEIRLLLEQVKGGLLTVDEARGILNMPPLPKSTAPQEEAGDA
jgi:HK97 family phage portal protein